MKQFQKEVSLGFKVNLINLQAQEAVPRMLATTLNAFPLDNEYANMSKSKE